jgi:hypothetical protein
MKARRVVSLLAVAAAMALIVSVSTLAQSGPPSVGYYTPSMGAPGTAVMLYGTLPSDTSVYFNWVYASDRTWIDSGRMRVTVPAGASTGPLIVGNSYGSTSPGTFYVPTPTPTTPPMTRYGVASTAGLALLPSVRQGVAVMQSRPVTDPTSWSFQAAMHGYMSGIPQPGWGSCQHGTLHFLSWHRMYLYYFERILRRASGNPSLTLPYWNYGDPAQRALPPAFRSPTTGNALYVSARSAAMNQGGQLTAAAVSNTAAFGYTAFTSFTSAFNGLEQQPHNIVHSMIGGWMGNVSTAAQDPIFYFHHANIDRLWKRWLSQGGGRSNPTGNSTWMNTQFIFYNEDGAQVTLTGAQILNTVSQLGYRYDDDTTLNGLAGGRVAEETTAAAAVTAAPAPLQELTTHEQVLDVGGAAVRVDVPLPLQASEKLSSVAARTSAGRVILTLDGIEFEENTGLYYEVYVNLPAGVAPDWQGPHFVGNMALFGLQPHGGAHAHHAASAARTFDVTAAVQRTGNSSGALSVTIVPRGPLAPSGKAAPIPANVSRVKINRVLLSSE